MASAPLVSTSPQKKERPDSRWSKKRWEQRRERRLQERPQERIFALELAEQLKQLAGLPENELFRNELNRLVHKTQTFGSRSRERDIKTIMHAIKYEQCNSVEDILDQTNIPEEIISGIVSEMLEAGAAELRPREGKRGPKRMDIYLTGTPFEGFVA
jgi:hypothetical protein